MSKMMMMILKLECWTSRVTIAISSTSAFHWVIHTFKHQSRSRTAQNISFTHSDKTTKILWLFLLLTQIITRVKMIRTNNEWCIGVSKCLDITKYIYGGILQPQKQYTRESLLTMQWKFFCLWFYVRIMLDIHYYIYYTTCGIFNCCHQKVHIF